MKVYVAGSSGELFRVRRAMDRLREAGVAITFDWTREVELVGTANPKGATKADRIGWAKADLSGVANADLLLVLVSPDPARGAYYEAGYAKANGVPTIFAGETTQSIFCSLGAEFAEDDEAVKFITAMAHMNWGTP